MASYFNLTLDTTAPAGVTVKINGDDIYTATPSVTLTIATTDSVTTGYQMKIWGIEDVATQEEANWETFAASKSVILPGGDGLKTVSVIVRDNVGNESAVVTDNITLDTSVPVVTITGPDVSVISKVATFDTAIFNFQADSEFTEYKVCVVPSSASTQDAGTVIPTTAGSANTSGSEGNYEADTNIQVTIKGTDLATASSADGVKIIKVFVLNPAGTWSQA